MGKKVLICIPDLGICNGVTTFILSFYDDIIQQGYQADFLLVENEHTEKESYVSEKGSRIYKVPKYSKYDKRRIDYIDRVFRNEAYDIVHVNFPGPNGAMVLKAARKYGVRHRIYHCHNPLNNLSLKSFLSEHVFTPICRRRANKYVACSRTAGKSIFGNRKFDVVNNAIDPTGFLFRPESRERIRKELQIEDRLVVGVAARMTAQKNPLFLVKVFAEIKKRNPNAVLLWVGDGELQERIEETCSKYGIWDSVVLAGRQSEIADWYSAMDLFLLPSRFEGLGIVYLEAQANGLSCFGSDCVPEETEVTERMHRISLSKSPSDWATEIVKTLDKDTASREVKTEEFKQKGYDSRFIKHRLCEVYESLYKE